jgi:hypothetical protein
MTDLRTAAQQFVTDYENGDLGDLKHYARALRAALEQPNECRWYQDGDEESGTYMASCNRRYFMFEDGTPTDNRMTHCCYCGKPLVEVPIEPEGNDD